MGIGDLDGDYEAFRQSAGGLPVARDFLLVSGADAVEYLQGQCSQDVASLDIDDTAETLLLSPQGKVDSYIRITRTGDDSFALDMDAGFGDVARQRLERFRLRVRVDIEPAAWECVSIRGPGAGSVSVPDHPGVRQLAVEHPGLSGFDLIGPSVTFPPSLRRCSEAAWSAVRIEAGIPVMGREITSNTIPAEAGLVERTVSFTKGCFTGQELVARLDARGTKVARRLCGIVISAAVAAEIDGAGNGEMPGSSLVDAAVRTGDGEHEVGRISSAAWSPGLGAVIGMATLQRRVSPPALVKLFPVAESNPEQGFEAEARPLPLVNEGAN